MCACVDEAGDHELTAAIGSLATDWCARFIPVLSLSLCLSFSLFFYQNTRKTWTFSSFPFLTFQCWVSCARARPTFRFAACYKFSEGGCKLLHSIGFQSQLDLSRLTARFFLWRNTTSAIEQNEGTRAFIVFVITVDWLTHPSTGPFFCSCLAHHLTLIFFPSVTGVCLRVCSRVLLRHCSGIYRLLPLWFWRNGGRATVPKDAVGAQSCWTVSAPHTGTHSAISGRRPSTGTHKNAKDYFNPTAHTSPSPPFEDNFYGGYASNSFLMEEGSSTRSNDCRNFDFKHGTFAPHRGGGRLLINQLVYALSSLTVHATCPNTNTFFFVFILSLKRFVN